MLAKGTRLLPERIVALQAYLPSKTVCDFRRYLGMLNFYQRLLLSTTDYQLSLHEAIVGQLRSYPVTWTPALEEAFSTCKGNLYNPTLLVYPSTDKPLCLFTDVIHNFHRSLYSTEY